MSDLIPTPRTDAALVEKILCTDGGDEECTVYPCIEHVEAEFARTLEIELAKERARLDFMSTRGFEHRHHETGDHLAYEWTISSTNEDKSVSLREVIDAAMKEAGL